MNLRTRKTFSDRSDQLSSKYLARTTQSFGCGSDNVPFSSTTIFFKIRFSLYFLFFSYFLGGMDKVFDWKDNERII